MMMELARVFQKHRGPLGRNIRLGFWTGHENGTYAASTWYLDRFWDEISDHGISLSVFDTPRFRNAPEYSVQVSELVLLKRS